MIQKDYIWCRIIILSKKIYTPKKNRFIPQKNNFHDIHENETTVVVELTSNNLDIRDNLKNWIRYEGKDNNTSKVLKGIIKVKGKNKI